jgi:hypothetical protein
MIIRATFENILSFCEETSINFIAGKSTAHPSQISRAAKRDDISLLKSGIVYGANASGKSNMIRAIWILQQIAIGKRPIEYMAPFKLKLAEEKTSKIELEFKAGDKFFAYGVEFTIKGIAEEWLFEITSRSEKEIFTRVTNNQTAKYSFGGNKGEKESLKFLNFLGQATPIGKSFLNEYVERNGYGLEEIKTVRAWMLNTLKIIFPNSRYQGISIDVEKDQDFKTATKSLLAFFNTGIADVRRFPISKEEVDLPRAMVSDILAHSEPGAVSCVASFDNCSVYFFDTNSKGVTKIYKQKTVHESREAGSVVFEMDEESDGSVRILDFIPMLIDLRLNNSVYLIDEIDRSMHPILSQKILEYYYTHLSQELDTQLIFTTHEANLLNLDLIRADEVWFVEKDANGASQFTSLAEYKPREDVRKGYLQGRYGAIPFFPPIKSLNW